MFGVGTDQHPYVHLLDGGHFDNIGLYEMVVRRCHFIVVSDASLDLGYTFEDLGKTVRRIAIALGIPITFTSGIKIDATHHMSGNDHFATGTIRYSAVDGPDTRDGVLLYIKPSVSGDEPIDVLNYSKTHQAFPNESTLDEAFDDLQFDSYRVLGLHSVEAITASNLPAISVSGA